MFKDERPRNRFDGSTGPSVCEFARFVALNHLRPFIEYHSMHHAKVLKSNGMLCIDGQSKERCVHIRAKTELLEQLTSQAMIEYVRGFCIILVNMSTKHHTVPKPKGGTIRSLGSLYAENLFTASDDRTSHDLAEQWIVLGLVARNPIGM